MNSFSPVPSEIAACRERLTAQGLNLWGVANLDRFDPAQCRGSKLAERKPGARSVIVIGSGGPACWDQLMAEGALDMQAQHPIDQWSRQVIDAEAERLGQLGVEVCTVYPFDSSPPNFLQLAEAAGLGVVSPVIGMLLHPRFGPWMSIRGAIVLRQILPVSAELDFDPCSGCLAPCLEACPVSTYSADGSADYQLCAKHRHRGGCADACAVRRACTCGQDARYSPDEERHRHSFSLGTLRRWYGLGLWRLLPSGLRRRIVG